MASVPALPVILLPPSICPAPQVLYIRTPAPCSVIWGPCQSRRDSGRGFPWTGRRATVAHMAQAWQWKGRQAGTEAYCCHCSSSILDNSQGALSGPPKSVLECYSDLLLYHSHRLWPAMYESTFSIFEHFVLAERPFEPTSKDTLQFSLTISTKTMNNSFFSYKPGAFSTVSLLCPHPDHDLITTLCSYTSQSTIKS